MKKLITLPEVAEMLHIKTDTAWRWARSGYLPSVTLGRYSGKGRKRRTLRFSPDAVLQWINEQGQPGRKERVPNVEVGR